MSDINNGDLCILLIGSRCGRMQVGEEVVVLEQGMFSEFAPPFIVDALGGDTYRYSVQTRTGVLGYSIRRGLLKITPDIDIKLSFFKEILSDIK